MTDQPFQVAELEMNAVLALAVAFGLRQMLETHRRARSRSLRIYFSREHPAKRIVNAHRNSEAHHPTGLV
jgi:hypothetical protein